MGIEVGLPARSRLGPYVIEDQIGRGGMAVVYRARHVKLERTVAIKVLLGYGSDEIGLRRFQREAQTVARLRHPHILAVFDYGEEAGLPYMATEFMPNGSLADRKRGRVLDAAEAVALLRPLAEALDYAHREGVIHRDVKPSNVFLDADWKPVLADFGISKLNSDEPLTATGNVAGTPAYMSPEQIKGGELSGASDVYSLAAMAYELLTGRTPFIGDDPWQILYGHVKLEPPAPSSLRAELPGGLDAVLASGLAKEPEARWNSCAAMLEAMEAAVEGKRVRPPGGHAGLRRARLRRLRLAGGAAVIILALTAAGLARMQLSGSAALPSGGLRSSALPAQPTGQAAARSLVVDSAQPLRVGADVSFHGSGLDPARRAVAGFLQGQDAIFPINDALPVESNGSFRLTGRVPAGLQSGEATLVACNLGDDGHFVPTRDCARIQVQVR